MEKQPKTVVMLLAHGTREPEASKPVFEYAKALAEATQMHVEPCLREFIEPSIPTVVAKCVNEGVERIVVVPFFLFRSGHVTRDIENSLAVERAKYPALRFNVGEPIGFDRGIVEILKRRLETVL
ncbi:MAG: CbiX/SirB N-terminal domain-containing protein [Pseudomonadota bacterium]